jgi:hypothetical protein
MIPENLTPLVWIVDPPAEDNMLKLSYPVPFDDKNDLVLQQLANDDSVIATIVIPRKLISGLAQELTKFITK